MPNPTRPEENFGEAWDASSFRQFGVFMKTMTREVRELNRLQSTRAVKAKLAKLFGEEPTGRAFENYGREFTARRKAGGLYVGGAGLTTSRVSKTVRVPDHEFYGDDEGK